MGTLKVDTVVGSDGTSPVTLTKQSAAKATFGYNQHANDYFNILSGQGSIEALNISTYDDDTTGEAGAHLINNMLNTQYIFSSGTLQTNNTCCLGVDASTSQIELVIRDADSSGTADTVWYGQISGDLA